MDTKSGAIINPHNPSFITQKPWYLGDQQEATLEHQAIAEEDPTLSLAAADKLVQAQRQKDKAAAKSLRFSKGQWVEALKKNKLPYRICKILKVNSKQTQFDLEFEDGTVERKVKFRPDTGRPRIRMTKTGARAIATGVLKDTYDSKRDAYHGYDQDAHNKKVARKFEQRDKLRQEHREAKATLDAEAGKDAEDKDGSGSDSDIDGDSSDEEFAQRDSDAKVMTTRLARQGGVGGAQMKVTARNLRIREDTAKYLRNLDPESAYYDPKSRSMRDNPNPEANEVAFAGDNFARVSGDAAQLAETQCFAWDATKEGVQEIHPQANPSQAEVLQRSFQKKAVTLQQKAKESILAKYGGEEYLDGEGGLAKAVKGPQKPPEQMAQDRRLRFGVQTREEAFSRDGRKAGKQQKLEPIPCKYEEDIFIHGHTTVWGSFFHKGAFRWGYDDDHSLMKASYGTGDNGRVANDEANMLRYGDGQAGSAALAQARGMLKAIPSETNGKSSKLSSQIPNRSALYGEADPNAEALDQKKVQEALKAANNEPDTSKDDRKRKYNSMESEVQMTAEEMEAYRQKKGRGEDPMAKIGSDELLDYKK